MDNTKIISVQPIALWRQDEHVILWFDQPTGWALLNGFGRLPKAARVLVATGMVRDYMDGAPNEMNSSVFVLPMNRTTIPRDMPNEALVGMHPSLASEARNGKFEPSDPTALADGASPFLQAEAVLKRVTGLPL